MVSPTKCKRIAYLHGKASQFKIEYKIVYLGVTAIDMKIDKIS